MVSLGKLELTVEVPEGIKSFSINDSTLTVKGKLGELTRDFSHTEVTLEKIDASSLKLTTYFPRKRNKALIRTVNAHILNMFNGVTRGYEYRMKIVFSHFPIRVKADQKKGLVNIENLYGGRKPKIANILGNKTKVVVDGEDVVVTGIDKEEVGQTCANIQEVTRQRGKRRQSPKTFMDGIFVFQRGLQPESQ